MRGVALQRWHGSWRIDRRGLTIRIMVQRKWFYLTAHAGSWEPLIGGRGNTELLRKSQLLVGKGNSEEEAWTNIKRGIPLSRETHSSQILLLLNAACQAGPGLINKLNRPTSSLEQLLTLVSIEDELSRTVMDSCVPTAGIARGVARCAMSVTGSLTTWAMKQIPGKMASARPVIWRGNNLVHNPIEAAILHPIKHGVPITADIEYTSDPAHQSNLEKLKQLVDQRANDALTILPDLLLNAHGTWERAARGGCTMIDREILSHER